MKQNRKTDGSMTMLVVLAVGLLVFVALCGMGFHQLLTRRSQAQFSVDATALSFAAKLNADDRIAQQNELEEAARELVFLSRQDANASLDAELQDLSALCNQLVDESRVGQELIQQERKNQIELTKRDIADAVKSYNQTRMLTNTFSFFGLKTFDPAIVRVDLGRLAQVDSSVRALDTIPDLYAADSAKAYFDKSSKLYKANVDTRLPDPDGGLEFKFASLPACVSGTATPPRNVNTDVFLPYGTLIADGKPKPVDFKDIPSAIEVYFSMDVTLPWEKLAVEPIGLVSAATTSGAMTSLDP